MLKKGIVCGGNDFIPLRLRAKRTGLSFPRFFVCHQVHFMQPVFPDVDPVAIDRETELATGTRASSDDDCGCRTLRCIRSSPPSSLACGVAPAMNALVFKTVEEAFGGRVVPAVAFTAHRALMPYLRACAERLGWRTGCRGRSDESAPAAGSAEPCHGQRIGHDVRSHARFSDQPTISRLNRSSTTARYNQPSSVQM